MNPPDVHVTVEGGGANVDVRTPNVIVEVRDYDVDGAANDLLWTDENGDHCVRYFATHDNEPPSDQQTNAGQSSTP